MREPAEVTLVVLVYRSLQWLDWVQRGVESARTDVKYRWHVVANDATAEVLADPRIDLEYTNDDPREFYINRVYRAWNAGVLEAPTQLVCMLNTDMWPHDYWLDELVAVKKETFNTVPTSLLVESGRLPSAMPHVMKNIGRSPDEFRADEFTEYAQKIRKPGLTEPGRLFMPILVDRQEFIDVGMYPEGNPPGTTGDKDLIRRYDEASFKHLTALGSVVYHVQLGEQEWP
jgi:hypothetical protein